MNPLRVFLPLLLVLLGIGLAWDTTQRMSDYFDRARECTAELDACRSLSCPAPPRCPNAVSPNAFGSHVGRMGIECTPGEIVYCEAVELEQPDMLGGMCATSWYRAVAPTGDDP